MEKSDSQASKMPIKFQTNIQQFGNNTGIQVPEEIIEQLDGGKRPLVKVTLNQYTYRSAVAVMNGKYMISLSAQNREAAGVQGGEEVEITLERDLEPRTVELPEDLKAALLNANALDAYENLAPSMKKEYVRQVVEAKKEATREKRIAKIVEKLS